MVCAIASLMLEDFDTGNLSERDADRIAAAAAELAEELRRRSGLDAIPATIDAITEAVSG